MAMRASSAETPCSPAAFAAEGRGLQGEGTGAGLATVGWYKRPWPARHVAACRFIRVTAPMAICPQPVPSRELVPEPIVARASDLAAAIWA